MGTPIFMLRLSCSIYYFQKVFRFHKKTACSIIPLLYSFLYFFWVFPCPIYSAFFSSELTTSLLSPPPTSSPLSSNTISSYVLASFRFSNLFPFLICGFRRTARHFYLLTVAMQAVTFFAITYTVTFFDFDYLFSLLCHYDDCNFDAPLLLALLLTL